jgi:hypothetical protein
MKLLLIQHVYPKKEHKQIRKFLLKKNQQTNKLSKIPQNFYSKKNDYNLLNIR